MTELKTIVLEAKAQMTDTDWTALVNDEWTVEGIETGSLGDDSTGTYTAAEVVECAKEIGQ